MINPLRSKQPRVPLPPFGDQLVATYDDAAALGLAFAGAAVPTPYELVRVDDPTGVSGLGRMAAGVIFPYDGGAVYRWQSPRPPAGWPHQVRQFAVFDSIAEVIAVHGHEGATILRTHDACDLDGLRLAEDVSVPEVFAIKDDSGDVPEWGVWYPHDDRAVTWAPPITPISGRRQVGRHTVWHTLSEMQERVDVRTGPSRGRVVWLTSHAGRALVRSAQAAALNMRHAEHAHERGLRSINASLSKWTTPPGRPDNAGPRSTPPAAATETAAQ